MAAQSPLGVGIVGADIGMRMAEGVVLVLGGGAGVMLCGKRRPSRREESLCRTPLRGMFCSMPCGVS